MASKKGEKRESEGSFDIGLGGIFKGLGDLVDKLSDLTEKGKEFQKTGEIKGLNKNLSGVYGFSIKVGGFGTDKVKVEPFGNIRKDKKGDVGVDEVREPLVDIFEEAHHIQIIAEMPGVDEKDIQVSIKDDILEISAETQQKKYYKEILLKESFTKDTMIHTYKNGVLEIKLAR
ncbi:MAG: Hsp20/alpha crystallin family protein [Candidatus Jettenia sp.]|nr:Hsp20/alpha crystallin family protein [Candidatus Jettenia sp.]UJS16021.1 MAG: Hsp20/alpha crystallin family protein [Candidatus Jettenia sp.]